MKIQLTTPDEPHKTVIDTEQDVTISEAFAGPILTNGDVCVSLFVRDDGFEGYCWRGSADHHEALPRDAVVFRIGVDGIEQIDQDDHPDPLAKAVLEFFPLLAEHQRRYRARKARDGQGDD